MLADIYISKQANKHGGDLSNTHGGGRHQLFRATKETHDSLGGGGDRTGQRGVRIYVVSMQYYVGDGQHNACRDAWSAKTFTPHAAGNQQKMSGVPAASLALWITGNQPQRGHRRLLLTSEGTVQSEYWRYHRCRRHRLSTSAVYRRRI